MQQIFCKDGLKEWAAAAYNYYNNPSNTKDMALTFGVTGFDSLGGNYEAVMEVVITSGSGVVSKAQ